MTEGISLYLYLVLPGVVETPTRVEVRCGETAVSVHEHGAQGSGSWAVWTGGGSVVGQEVAKYHPTIGQALAAAGEYVRDKERSRLLYAQLSAKLAGAEEPRPEPATTQTETEGP
jgi:hypothetical protein